MTATATISSKCRTLTDAAIKRWPDIFGEEIRQQLVKKLDKIQGEPAQVLATRAFLLEWAAGACGKCEDCSLFNNRCCGAVFGDGNPNARIFIIGEGPGQYEQRSTIPFTYAPELSRSFCRIMCENFLACHPLDAMKNGTRLPECVKQRKPVSKETAISRVKKQPIPHISTAAEYLDRAIQGLFARDCWNNGRVLSGEERVTSDMYITNLVRCRSIKKDGENQAPLVEYSKACWKWLELQLTIVQPQVAIVLGGPACSFIMGDSDFKISENDGKFGVRPEGHWLKLPSSVKNVGVAYHPSYIKHEYDKSKAAGDAAFKGIRNVFEEAHAVLNGG